MTEEIFILTDKNGNTLEFVNDGRDAIYTKKDNGEAKEAFLLSGIEIVDCDFGGYPILDTEITYTSATVPIKHAYSFTHYKGKPIV